MTAQPILDKTASLSKRLPCALNSSNSVRLSWRRYCSIPNILALSRTFGVRNP